jgi:hypothetical protein
MSTRSVVAAIISTIDFSQFNFKYIKDVNLSALDLSSFPQGDFHTSDSTVGQLNGLRDSILEDIRTSRISSDKKENSKKLFEKVIKNVDTYLNVPDTEDSDTVKYDALCSMRNNLSSMDLPSRCKSTVSSILSSITSQTDCLKNKMYEREGLLRELKECIVEESTKYRVGLLTEELKVSPLTVDFLLKDNDHIIAARKYVNETFGGGAYFLVSALGYAKKMNHPYPIIEWQFDEDVYGTVKCAKALGITKFAFSGKSTAALTNLNIITKLGLQFSIEEVTFERTFGEVTEPLAVVNVA